MAGEAADPGRSGEAVRVGERTFRRYIKAKKVRVHRYPDTLALMPVDLRLAVYLLRQSQRTELDNACL